SKRIEEFVLELLVIYNSTLIGSSILFVDS
ncbi:unnamed protein product, partial [Rotaria sordida]